MEMMGRLRYIFLEGKVEAVWNELTSSITFSPENLADVKKLLDPFEGGKTGTITLCLEETAHLFDVDLPLGNIKPIRAQAKLANADEVSTKLQESTEGTLEIKFVPDGANDIVKEYVDWFPAIK